MSTYGSGQQFVVFALAGEHYALPIDRVQEIIRFQPLRTIVASDSTIRGVLNLRDRLVPVHDLAGLLGASGEPASDANIMIIESGAATVGVIVDAVEEVLRPDPGAFEEVPAADSPLIRSLVRHGDRIIVLLDPAAIVPAAAYAA